MLNKSNDKKVHFGLEYMSNVLNFLKPFSNTVPISITLGATVVFSIFGVLWALIEPFGLQSSWQLGISIFLVSVSIFFLLIFVCKVIAWKLLLRSVRQYIENHLFGHIINENTILVSGGAGGCLAVGIVAKALQDLGKKVPKTFCIDIEYAEDRLNPQICEIFEEIPKIKADLKQNVLIVHSYIGTGRSLEVLRKALGLEEAPVFSFVISNAVFEREKVDHFLIRGTRSIIPWRKSIPYKK